MKVRRFAQQGPMWAVQVADADVYEIGHWCGAIAIRRGDLAVSVRDGLVAHDGDWIVRIEESVYQVYTDQQFRLAYEAVDE